MSMNENEIKEILERQEKTQLLVEKLWKAEKWRHFFTILRYVIFLGVIFGSFYFLTPYIEKLIGLINEFQSIQDPQGLQKFLDQLKK